MTKFNRMTIVAAAEIIEQTHSQNQFTTLATQWGVEELCDTGALVARTNALSKTAIEDDRQVFTVSGMQMLSRAMIECAIASYDLLSGDDDLKWKKLIAGLRFDGYEVVEEETGVESDRSWGQPPLETKAQLVRMLPSDIPELDFREAENQVEQLLNRHSFATATGHLKQAMNAFQRGDWAASNSQLRTFYQDLLDKIAENLGCDTSNSDDAKRQYLADIESGPFLIHEYNEWKNDRGRPAFILGLWARLHTHGSHPGLSDEDDAAFRLQITLITARLLMRRFDERKKSA